MPKPLTHPLDQEPGHHWPGLHIISNFVSDHSELLRVSAVFHKFIDAEIQKVGLSKVGEAYHDFEGGGFTAVIALAESHLSIHTWPDQGFVTFDIFLSNYNSDNSPRAEALYKAVVNFYDAAVTYETRLER